MYSSLSTIVSTMSYLNSFNHPTNETTYVDSYLDLAVTKIAPENILNDKTEVNLKCNGDLKIGHPVGSFCMPTLYSFE